MEFPHHHALSVFAKTSGAISLCEGVAIHYLASLCPEGDACELGSHAGKAATMAAAGFKTPRKFHLVDPCYDPKNKEAWANTVQGDSSNAWCYIHEPGFNGSVTNRIHDASNGEIEAVLHGDYSLHAIPEIPTPISYCMVDSNDHAYQLCHDELQMLKGRMAIGGIIVLHDFQSQFLGVEQAYREMLEGGFYNEVPIDWPTIIDFVKGSGFKESESMSWHHREMEFPCFLGALIRMK